MTDRENHTTSNGVKLTIADQNPDQVCVMMYDHRSGPSSHVGMILPTSRLLAMIDSSAPDAMRGYLRERSDYLDSPHDRPNLAGTGAAAEHFDYLDAVPEVDSPEDVDEHPAPVITVTPEALDAIELLGRVMADLRDAYARGLAR